MQIMPDAVKRQIWEGFRDVGVLNGMVPVVKRTEPDDPDHEMMCFKGKDGSEFWRHVDLGSV